MASKTRLAATANTARGNQLHGPALQSADFDERESKSPAY
jgi:hypothetical protein